MRLREDTELHVSLQNLGNNFDLLKHKTSLDSIFMIKANAYGHGLEQVFEYSSNELEQKNFGVASLNEAMILRKRFPQSNANIFVFSELNLENQQQRELYAQSKVIPVIHSISDLQLFLDDPLMKHVPLVLKFNTGMNRLGLMPDELSKMVTTLKAAGRKSIDHLMTHYACSYLPYKPKSKSHHQWEAFQSLRSELQGHFEIRASSTANSGAIEQGFGLDGCNYVRPGLMLYGPQSCFKGKHWDGKLISNLRTKVMKVFSVNKGDEIGYGATKVPKDGWITCLPLGYGDGFHTHYRGSSLLIEGQKAEVFGRVNMDLTFLFTSEQPKWGRGQWIQIWGDAQEDLNPILEQAKTIPYEIFTSLTNRIPRVYFHS
jgi:alanine racemase